jgi:hypothetical protein
MRQNQVGGTHRTPSDGDTEAAYRTRESSYVEGDSDDDGATQVHVPGSRGGLLSSNDFAMTSPHIPDNGSLRSTPTSISMEAPHPDQRLPAHYQRLQTALVLGSKRKQQAIERSKRQRQIQARESPGRNPLLRRRLGLHVQQEVLLARDARTNMGLLSTLGSGRSDPFNVYVAQDLPTYIHQMLDHAMSSACKAYIPSEKENDLLQVRSDLMQEMMNQPLAWYSVIMASITHHAFVQRKPTLPHHDKLLALSYRTKTMSLIQEDMQRNGGVPSEAGLIAIATLIVNGSQGGSGGVVTAGSSVEHLHSSTYDYDSVQMRKAFGRANDMDYYSSVPLEHSHWLALARFVERRGGVHAIKIRPLVMVVASADSLVAWRTLSKPITKPFVATALALMMAVFRPDAIAGRQMREMLSGLPSGFRTCGEKPYASLHETLQHVRTIVVRFDQYARCHNQRHLRPDLRQIHMTRILVIHDLMSLPAVRLEALAVEPGENNPSHKASSQPVSDDVPHQSVEQERMNLVYELIRHALMAFMQLVLFPISRVNDQPQRLLRLLVPLLRLARKHLSLQQEEARRTAVMRDSSSPESQASFRSGSSGTSAGSRNSLFAIAGAKNAAFNRVSVDVDVPLYLWTWMLAGMLAFEHMQSTRSGVWMEELQILIGEMEDIPGIKRMLGDDRESVRGKERADGEEMQAVQEDWAWARMRALMRKFIWLDCECESPGRQWWEFVCSSRGRTARRS